MINLIIDADGVIRQIATDATVAILAGEQIVTVDAFDPALLGRATARKVKGKWLVEPVVPPPPPLDQVKSQARAKVIAFADQITARITGQYPAAEVASWPTQEAEARDIVAGADAAAAPLLSTMAADAKTPLTDYAQSVLVKATAYRQVVAAVKSIRDDTDVAINAATTAEAVGAALEQARQAALAKAATLGLA
ncbi:MAG: hypothetical protein K2X10_11625 [Hyphomicrobiales bacterium]|nr:hypothetical protein [Hyphomicrobiales bacterium]